MAQRKQLTPHQRIMRAADAGKGLRLSAADVLHLSKDDAVSTAAARDDYKDQHGEDYD